MAKVRHLAQGTPLPEWFLDEVQEFLSSYASPNFKVEIKDNVTLRVLPVGDGAGMVCIAIGNPADTTKYGWRWIQTEVTAAAPGSLTIGMNDVYVVSTANGPYSGSAPEVDTGTMTFGLMVLPSGTPPSGTGAQAYYRKVARVGWSGTKFTSVIQTVGPAAPLLAPAAAVSLSGLNSQFPNGVPYDGAKGTLLFGGGGSGTNLCQVPVTYSAIAAQWIQQGWWESVQTVSPVMVTGVEQDVPQADWTFGFIPCYKQMYDAGLRPYLWAAGLLSASSGPARLNARLIALTHGDAVGAATVVASNLTHGASVVAASPSKYALAGWLAMTDLTAPTQEHALIAARLAADSGGSNTATSQFGVLRVRMQG